MPIHTALDGSKHDVITPEGLRDTINSWGKIPAAGDVKVKACFRLECHFKIFQEQYPPQGRWICDGRFYL